MMSRLGVSVSDSAPVRAPRRKGKLKKTASGARMTKVSEQKIGRYGLGTRQAAPLGLNGRKVVARRYSLKDAKGNSLEEWNDIVARVVAHVSTAETDPAQRDLFYKVMSDI